MSTIIKLAVALATLTGAASAQVIDATEYVPLGVFNQWRYVQDDDPEDTVVADIGSVDLVNGVVRYNLRVPFLDSLDTVRMQLGVEDGELLVYRMRFQSEEDFEGDVELDPIRFDPPLVVGTTSTELGVDVFENEVDELFEAEIEFGPLDEDVDVRVTGTITVSWRPAAAFPGTPVTTPVGDGVELANWHWEFDLFLEAVDEDYDATFIDTADTLNGRGIGILVATDPNSSLHVLDAAILPGETLGGAFPPKGTSLRELSFDTPGVFHLEDAVVDMGTDGVVTLSDLYLEHNLSGKAFLRGMVTADVPPLEEGDAPEPVPFEMKGKLKGNSKQGVAKLGLKGKVKGLLEKPLILSAKAVVDPDSSALLVAYKSGKELAGGVELGITPRTAESAVLAMNTDLVDTVFKLKAKRKLGAEAVLDLDGAPFPLTVRETRKSKEGQPDKHGYQVTQTGLTAKLLKASSTSTEAADYTLAKFSTKLFGFKVRPESVEDVDTEAADADED